MGLRRSFEVNVILLISIRGLCAKLSGRAGHFRPADRLAWESWKCAMDAVYRGLLSRSLGRLPVITRIVAPPRSRDQPATIDRHSHRTKGFVVSVVAVSKIGVMV